MTTPTDPLLDYPGLEVRADGTLWFNEYGEMWKGQTMGIQVKKVIENQKSEFQHILIFDSESLGRVMCLDGAIQTTDSDEFSYQEMIVHLPLCSHADPKAVLVIGGGDGGVCREVLRHEGVERVVWVDIDGKVMDLCREHLPNMSAAAFASDRVDRKVADGFAYLRDNKGAFDAIIVDSSDPIGPAASLFEAPFYKLMKESLKDGGIVCTQGECQWLHLDMIADMLDFSRTLYPNVRYAFTTIPTYPSGQIGFILCSKDGETDLSTPRRQLPDAVLQQLRYYSPEVHSAAFVLPAFAARKLIK